jgi:CDP-diacylglycerol---serine O-phosphatidyltransferase
METISSGVVSSPGTARRTPLSRAIPGGLRQARARPVRAADGDRFRPHLTLANGVTTASLLSGLAAMFEATRTGVPLPPARLRLVIALIAVSAVLDAVDGPIARRRGTAGPFGTGLDSLADMVAFGVAPAVGLYYAQLHAVPVAGGIAAAAWCVCASWRLARHPLCARRSAFTGCPVPLGAVVVGALSLEGQAILTLIAAAAVSILMVGRLPFPTWHAVAGHLRSRGGSR